MLKGRYAIPRTLHYPSGRPDRSGPSPALLLEAMAQAGGWLIKVTYRFEVLGIMSVVKNFTYQEPLPTSGVLRIDVGMGHQSDSLISIRGTLAAGGRRIATVEAIRYVMVGLDQDGVTSGKKIWAMLTGGRRLPLVQNLS